MAAESSFDIVCKVDMQEVDNAVNQVRKEVSQRFDFKGSKSDIVLDKEKGTLTLTSEDDFKLKSLDDILQSKIIKRGISLRTLNYGKVEQAGGNSVRQVVTLQQGIPQDKAKEIVKIIKNTKLKVNAAIQKDQVRVSGKSLDDLQAIIAQLKGEDLGIDMQFENYR
ncbi:MAG: YajQ family cyclic di-GMP-binding protein [Nitrospirae bacterium]|nr:YajQ family cyclic di-GMP-binding protein [Nitrospirota bacterium]